MASKLHGGEELTKALKDLRDTNAPAWRQVLRASVSTPMNAVKRQAAANLRGISSGNTAFHKVYTGETVQAGHAAKSVKVEVTVDKKRGSATARLGVLKTAFYAVSFLELGTSKMPRFPWLLPAFQASRDQGVRLVAEAMFKRIEAIAKKYNKKPKGVR